MKRTNASELLCYIYPDTKTMEIMNAYEGYEPQRNPYEKLIVRNEHKVFAGNYIISYCLIITRASSNQKSTGNITFSEFKKDKTTVYNYFDQMVRESVENGSVIKKKDYYHKTPYLLRAQNRNNRIGYGWEWDWSDGYGDSTPGTFYGETTSYLFAGIRIINIQERRMIDTSREPVNNIVVPKNLRIEKTWFRGKNWLKISDGNDTVMVEYKKGLSRDMAISYFVKFKKGKH